MCEPKQASIGVGTLVAGALVVEEIKVGMISGTVTDIVPMVNHILTIALITVFSLCGISIAVLIRMLVPRKTYIRIRRVVRPALPVAVTKSLSGNAPKQIENRTTEPIITGRVVSETDIHGSAKKR